MAAKLAWVCLGAALSFPAMALDLVEAWRLLREQGPIYRAALYEKQAGEENRALGLAGLLPQVSASANKSLINGTSRQPDLLGRQRESKLDYTSQNASVQLRQPVFNWQRIAEYRQGQQRAEFSEAVFDIRSQEAIVNLVTRYFSVLLAQDTLSLAESKLKAFAEEVAAATRRFEHGEGAITDVDEATARRDLAQAELIEAQDNLVVSKRNLQELLGDAPQSIASLRSEFPTPPLEPQSLSDWLAKAETDNPGVRARQRSYEIAQQEVERARGGHFPEVDFLLGYSANESESVSTLNQRNRYSSVGLQVTIPIFSGGSVSAQVRQAAANREKAREELNSTREQVLSEANREFRVVQSGEARVRALETATTSSERALRSAKMGFKAGVRTNVDILNAEEQVFSAKRDLVEAKLRYLMARVRLVAIVGRLDDTEIGQINAYLGPSVLL